MIVHSSFDRAHVRLVRLVRRRGLALLMCLFLLLVFLPGPCLGFRLALSHAVYLRMLLTCLEVAAIEVDFVAAKVIDLVVGLVNLTHVGASLEKVVGSLLLVLVRVRGLVVGLRRRLGRDCHVRVRVRDLGRGSQSRPAVLTAIAQPGRLN